MSFEPCVAMIKRITGQLLEDSNLAATGSPEGTCLAHDLVIPIIFSCLS
jgi:hypothetical protein